MNSRLFVIPLVVLALAAGCRQKEGVITASGTVEVRQVDLASRITSRVEEFLVDEGAAVKKGEIIARLDDRIVRAQKETAGAVHAQVKTNFERSKSLLASRSIPREQFDAAATQLIKAHSDLRQAEILLEEAEVRAPWDGVVLKKNAEIGELVSPNTSVATLGDLSTAKVTIYVPLPDLGRITLNQAARVSIDAFPGKYYEGRITNIADKAEFTPKNVQTKDERVKEVFAVEVTVPNPARELKPGMPADVEVVP